MRKEKEGERELYVYVLLWAAWSLEPQGTAQPAHVLDSPQLAGDSYVVPVLVSILQPIIRKTGHNQKGTTFQSPGSWCQPELVPT